MATDSIQVMAVFPAAAERVYEAWLDSALHTAMTGGDAEIDASIGGEHTAWGGYIYGKTLELEPGRRIVQTWYATDFPEGSDDSQIVVTIEPDGDRARVQITHTDIPEGMGESFVLGWHQHYFTPMMAFFETDGEEALDGEDEETTVEMSAAKKPAAKKTPVAKKSAAKKPAAKKSAAKKPAAKKSAAKKPVAKKPAAKKSAARKSAAKKPAAKKSAKKAAKTKR